MLDQEDDQELDDKSLTDDERLTHFSKDREKNLGRVKGSELPSVQGLQSSKGIPSCKVEGSNQY